MLALAVVCLVPSTFALVRWAITPVSERLQGSMLGLAVVELRAGATRSIALAGVAALAVYGSVAIQGARRDLTRGLDQAIVQYLGTADICVTTGDNVFTTDTFKANGAANAIARAPGVASVRTYQGGLLDVGTRRYGSCSASEAARCRGPPSWSAGDPRQAARLIRGGGWRLSQTVSPPNTTCLSEPFTCPPPSGSATLRVAAITTNAGWPAARSRFADYRRYWQTADPPRSRSTCDGVTLRKAAAKSRLHSATARACGCRHAPPAKRSSKPTLGRRCATSDRSPRCCWSPRRSRSRSLWAPRYGSAELASRR
jgi:putative ABC transport system permease protein